MENWPEQSITGLERFYGAPGKNGKASRFWEMQNIVTVKPPWPIYTSWSMEPMRGIRIHRKCAPSLRAILDTIWSHARQDERRIIAWGMHLCGGGHAYRLMRGANRLSTHSYGCAVDFDPERNSYGDETPFFARCPEVVAAFDEEGWQWGGRWEKKDGMHFQATD